MASRISPKAIVFSVVLVFAMGAGALTLDEATCASLSEFDSQGVAMATLVEMMVPGNMGTWPEWDSEYNVSDPANDGDGIPDNFQMAILAAVLCADPAFVDPEVNLAVLRQEYQTNLDIYTQFVTDLTANASLISTGGQQAYDVGVALRLLPLAVRNQVVNLPEPGDTLGELANYFYTFGDSIVDYASYISMAVALADSIKPWAAGMLGLNEGVQSQLEDWILGDVNTMVTLTSDTNIQALHDLAAALFGAGSISAALRDQIDALADTLDQVVMVEPVFQVFTAGVAGSDPFAAASDWNNDGITNKQAYDIIAAQGGDREDFVRAVTTIFWAGNPNLPVGSVSGLVLLAWALAGAGALRLRK